MEFDSEKLEKWVANIPECKNFLYGFFMTCKGDRASAWDNYSSDIEIYGRTDRAIKANSDRLFQAFYDIIGIGVYYG